MIQITARLPETLVEALDAAARELNRSRADLVRQAIERYLENFDDLTVALKRLRDPTDPALDWDDVRQRIAEQYRDAYAAAPDGGEELAGWSEEGSWPEI